MAANLVIVESPTKAKTIAKFLGKGYKVLSSFGHIRDLPKKKMGIDVEKDFAPDYAVPTDKKKTVTELKKAAASAKTVYFATDEDREGEAISWHLAEILKLDPKEVKRITFHEITEEAIEHALAKPRHIDMRLVDAQQARRILDRLVGYELSPFLWRKVARGLSAGRVQSVVVRLIVEREREILAFVPQEYWSIEAMLAKKVADRSTLVAKLVKKGDEMLDKMAIPNEAAAKQIEKDLEGAGWTVSSIERKDVRRSPSAPFTTSTLQQEANNKLGFSAKQTMMLAQQLYEGVELGEAGPTGLITYMRTDSTNLAEKFVAEAREMIGSAFGKKMIPDEARKYKTKAKGAQEAHEAIRPTSAMRKPDDIASHLDDRQLKLYSLIWRRAVASQMIDAVLSTMAVNIDAAGQTQPYVFRATGSTIKEKGFMEVYETETKETLLPPLAENEALDLDALTPKQHFTEPPPRFTEASLVKTLEENGIGRPSTYAPTISTVVDRGYVEKEERKLKPTDLAMLVNDLLVAHFPDIVDSQFTAHMEESLDLVAEGEKDWVPVIRAFYGPFKKNLKAKEKEIDKKDVTETATKEVCDKCGKPMIIKIGRFGRFMACSGYPECRNTKPLPGSEESKVDVSGEVCPKCGAPMMVKRGRFGEFLSCSKYPECKTIKPILKKTGAKCTECKQGDIIEKKSRKGKIFFACSRYPDCTFALWSKPTGENCPTCGGLLVYAKGDMVRCSKEGCGFEKEAEKK